MPNAYSYACKNYPGMEKCPGRFYAETESELWKLIELHASVAHNEDPATWSTKDRDYLKTLIKAENGSV
jgi:Protein of unknown function (DUF1059)